MPLGLRFPIRARVARNAKRTPDAPKPPPVNRARLDRLLSGCDGGRARRLLLFLQAMTLADGAALLAHVKLDNWSDASPDARQDALGLINSRIVHLRERAGLAPFDDPLPGERDNVSIKLRGVLGL